MKSQDRASAKGWRWPIHRISFALFCAVSVFLFSFIEIQAKPPNVLFLVVDDMRDWVGYLEGYEGKVSTPNIDSLAARGTAFLNAHVPSPKCGPCRAAVLTGRMPSRTGIYGNTQWLEPNFPDIVTLPEHFRRNGYLVKGAGKIFHHTAGFHPPKDWDEFLPITFSADPWLRGDRLNYPWTQPMDAPPSGYPFGGHKGLAHEMDWGDPGTLEAEMDDTLSADFAIAALEREHSQPFFLACGLFRPHQPWYVPQVYLDLYPEEQVVLPTLFENDLDDVPEAAVKMHGESHRTEFQKIKQAGKWRAAVAAYLASISYADAQIGRILRSLNGNAYAENTIVVLWSDHGFHLGEKGKWHKDTLWEVATRVPFIIYQPGQQPALIDEAVSLIDLYPTLVDLCNLPALEGWSGQSLVPLLDGRSNTLDRPATIEFGLGNAAVRDERWRYICYADGSDELYDHETDSNEWYNLVPTGEHQELINELAKWLPKDWAAKAKSKSAYHFDSATYQWNKK